ncbi:MAG: 30S ribosomal protein S20 [Hyphomicrobiales bacterium]|nr:30S ribosomal protein S20 [Hyphomicrobiales bacterium]
MANTKSAKKAVRQISRRTEVNKSRRSRMRTFIRQVETAIAAGDQAAAQEALKAAQPQIARAAQRGVIHRNTAARRISRLSARIRAMGA